MNLIEARGVGKLYFDTDPPTVAIRGADLVVKAGEFVSIMGPSGSGKSTLLHILGLLDKPTEGEYLFAHRQVSTLPDKELASLRNEKIGFVFQSFNLLPKTSVLQNVLLPLGYSQVPEADWMSRAKAVLEAVGLSHRLGHETSELSGGEKQRTAIARTFVTQPEIIFADEPTGNLDSQSGETVLKLFEKFNAEGKTVILITHDEKVARFARRVIRVYDGKIIGDEVLI